MVSERYDAVSERYELSTGARAEACERYAKTTEPYAAKGDPFADLSEHSADISEGCAKALFRSFTAFLAKNQVNWQKSAGNDLRVECGRVWGGLVCLAGW